MATIVGSGDFKYRIIENWAKLPDGWSFKEVAAVGVDSKDNVYAFGRGEHPIMVFDRDGNFLRSWGEGQYPRAHGVHMGPDESIYLTDDGGHFVRKRYAQRPVPRPLPKGRLCHARQLAGAAAKASASAVFSCCTACIARFRARCAKRSARRKRS